MAEHKYAQVLRWLADGQSVEACVKPSYGWLDFPSDFNEGALAKVLGGYEMIEPYQFRLKPRTVMIGSREVEAPVLEPGDRQKVWCWDSDFNKPEEQYVDSDVAKPQFKLGLCFASEEACQAAHDAIHALLRGDA